MPVVECSFNVKSHRVKVGDGWVTVGFDREEQVLALVRSLLDGLARRSGWRSLAEPDGRLEEASLDVFELFEARLFRWCRDRLVAPIPPQIALLLDLKPGDIVQVAVRRR